MLNELVNRLRGQVQVRAECPYPERVLNLCAARGLSFWDLTWSSPTAFTCRMRRRDYGKLQQLSDRLECRLQVLRREGTPFFLLELRKRPVLLSCLVLLSACLFLGTFFVWDYEVSGNVTVPEERILRALERNGAGPGAFGLALDGEDLRNHILLEIPELLWIGVNVSGCRAYVQVRERTEPPEPLARRSPQNIVARRQGLVQEVRALGGVAAVVPGETVEEGQLLISGVEDLAEQGSRVSAGRGSVRARTWYTLSAALPAALPEKRFTGEEKTGLALLLGKKRIKFYSNSSIEGQRYDKIINRQSLSLLGVPLPVTLVRETWRFYEAAPGPVQPGRALRQGEAALRGTLAAMVAPWGEVRSAVCSARQRGDILEITLRAECLEEIGAEVPVLTEERRAG